MKVAIFHIGRCGSTVLAHMLRENHASITHVGDPFTKNKNSDAIPLIKKMIDVKTKHVIFDCKPFNYEALGKGHGIDMTLDEFIEGVKKDIGVDKIVILKRNNYLKRNLSVLISEKTGVWHNYGKKSAWVEPVELTDAQLEWFSGAYYNMIDEWYEKMEGIADLVLTYEDHVEKDPKVAYTEICNLIGVTPKKCIDPGMSKTNPLNVRASVTNFKEVEEAFKGTKYEWMVYK